MLNRRTSNYIFYGSLVLILALVFLVRTVVLSQMNAQITTVTNDNRNIQDRIDDLEEIVQDNKFVEIDHLYTLFGHVPNIYNQTELTYYTIAKLELVGVTEDPDMQRQISIDDEVSFPVDSEFDDISDEFKVVEVEVYFNTIDIVVVDQFIDSLYQSEQVFIVNSIEYYSPDGTNYIGVTVKFLSFYNVDYYVKEEAN